MSFSTAVHRASGLSDDGLRWYDRPANSKQQACLSDNRTAYILVLESAYFSEKKQKPNFLCGRP
jgi:hypothetical protein